MASIFTVSENDLFNFELFCDSKFVDANCRKYGFFKIKLHESCAKQCTTLLDINKRFFFKCLPSVVRFIPARNPAVKNLYGTTIARASTSEQTHYVDSLLGDTTNFQVSSNCCMQELENGKEALLQHCFASVKNVTVCNNHKDSFNTVRKRAASLRKAFDKRQSLKNITSLEERSRAYDAALASEEITHSSSHLTCHCDSCALTNDREEMKSHSVGSFYCPGIEEDKHDFVYTTANFAMSHLCYSNMLCNLQSVYSGVSYPALYLGGMHSYFPLHIEDLSLWSFNFLLHGYPKFWIMIPPTSVSRLTDALQKRGNFGNLRWCRNLLHHKYFIPTVQFFIDEDIPYELVVQYEGEGIVLLPNCAHAGWNLGPNLAEACNFGTSNWIPYGCVSPQCNCTPGAVHADLSDLVAVHQPTLLQAYRNEKVYDEIKDPYFHQSHLFPKMGHIVEPSIKQETIVESSRKQERSATCVPSEPDFALAAIPSDIPVLGAKKPRLKCPLCHVSWASVQKVNMRTHLRKYHEPLIDREAVRKFIQQYSISLK